jgi:hypothetical protein
VGSKKRVLPPAIGSSAVAREQLLCAIQLTHKLRFRRVDRYLTPLVVPLKTYADGRGATRSYHRPLEAYVSGLANCGLLIDRLLELPTYQIAPEGPHARAENLANREFPVFLGLRAWKFG